MSPTVLCAKCLKNPCPCEPASEPGGSAFEPPSSGVEFKADVTITRDMLAKPYSVRIPAAIKKAEKHSCDDWPCTDLTANQLALAKALWALLSHLAGQGREYMVDHPPSPLIEFCEIVESL